MKLITKQYLITQLQNFYTKLFKDADVKYLTEHQDLSGYSTTEQMNENISGAVSAHNTSETAHSDIRAALTDIDDKIPTDYVKPADLVDYAKTSDIPTVSDTYDATSGNAMSGIAVNSALVDQITEEVLYVGTETIPNGGTYTIVLSKKYTEFRMIAIDMIVDDYYVMPRIYINVSNDNIHGYFEHCTAKYENILISGEYTGTNKEKAIYIQNDNGSVVTVFQISGIK